MTAIVTAVALGVLAVAAWLLQDLAADILTPTVEDQRQACQACGGEHPGSLCPVPSLLDGEQR